MAEACSIEGSSPLARRGVWKRNEQFSQVNKSAKEELSMAIAHFHIRSLHKIQVYNSMVAMRRSLKKWL